MAVPDWLTADFLQSCLQSQEEQLITVTKHTVESAVEPGNNYGSQLFRVKIDFIKGNVQNSVSLIVKGPLSEYEDTLKDFYAKEPKFYNEFVTETYKYNKHDLVPKHYISPIPSCIVLEDLIKSGYKMVNRSDLLDLEHCRHYIKAEAKLNALSVAVHKQNPKLIESLVQESPEHVSKLEQMTKGVMVGGLRCMAAYLEDAPNCEEYFAFISEGIENDTLWKMYQEEEKSNGHLKALIQLDPWCTNMMFKYNSQGGIDSVKLLDFQHILFTSPVRELLTFLSLSPNMEVRKTKLNYLYRLYCDELNKNLAQLGCPERLSFKEMKAEIVTKSVLVLMNICALLPICLFEGVGDLSDITSGNILYMPVKESPIYKLYQGKNFNRLYPQVLHEIAKEGVFSYLKEEMKKIETK